MLEKPDLAEEEIAACLWNVYGIRTAQIDFLPLGADVNTAVYRACEAGEGVYFVKLRRGPFNQAAVRLARFLHEQGVASVIPPLPGKAGGLWALVAEYRLVLYPFIAGQNGYEMPVGAEQWLGLGRALRQIHALDLPAGLAAEVRPEKFSPHWRRRVTFFLGQLDQVTYTEPAAADLAGFLREKRAETAWLVARAGQLARQLKAGKPERVLCHSDIHGGNLLIEPGGGVYIVDWDEPILAPRERDLMCAGSGIMGSWHSPQEEETLFYSGYGLVQPNPDALAYYRYERIIMDIAAYCEQLLLSDSGGVDRWQSLHYLKSNYEPGGTIAIARRADRAGERD